MKESQSVFTRIIAREIPAHIQFENERIIVIASNEPKAPIHLLAIPKHPFVSMDELLQDASQSDLLWELYSTLQQLAVAKGIATSGYKLIANCGPDSGQTVPHLHIHLLGGAPLVWEV
jgi:histidine triad (HIT) family protein